MPVFRVNSQSFLSFIVMYILLTCKCALVNSHFVVNFSWKTATSGDFNISKTVDEDLSIVDCEFTYYKAETLQCSSVHASFHTAASCNANYSLIHNATHLIITNSTVSPKKLKDLIHLRYLVFRNTTLTDLNEHTFQGFSLCQLSIVQCGLDTVHPDLFVPLLSLVSLDLSANGLSHLPDSAFSVLSNLLRLNLCKNNLKWIPSRMLQDLRHLKELDLSENSLYAVSYVFFVKLKSIQLIHLQKNKIRYFINRAEYTVNSSLIHLDLSDNLDLPVLPENFLRSLQRLENLYLENCRLKYVSSELLRHLVQLRRFSLKNNYIENLPRDLLENSHFLKWLDLSLNRLSTIPDAFFVGTPKLSELKLSFNSFKQIPKLHLETLKSLNLSHNHIKRVDSNIVEKRSNLEILDLSHNSIEEASFNFQTGYKKLLVLQLSHNLLRSPPSVIPSYRESLEVLDLSDNLISVFEIPSVIPYGVTYDLRNNRIHSIIVNTSNFFSTKLLMSHREFLGRKVVAPTYYLSGNILNCDCTLRNFLNFSVGNRGKKHGYPIVINDEEEITCTTPENLAGMSLHKAHVSNPTCIITKNCPLKCSCYSYNQESEVFVNCSKSNLFEMPSILPDNSTVIDLTGNHLTSFSTSTFQSSALAALREIYLTGNRLSRIYIDLEKSELRILDLRNNAFRTIPIKLSNRAANLSLFIGGNPFECDCPDMLLKKWFEHNEQVFADAATVQCSYRNKNFVINRIRQNDLCSRGTDQNVMYNNFAIIVSLCLLYVLRNHNFRWNT